MATRTVRPRTVGAMTDEEREQSNRRQAELESMRAAANPATPRGGPPIERTANEIETNGERERP